MVMLIKLEGEKTGPRALGMHGTLEHLAVQAQAGSVRVAVLLPSSVSVKPGKQCLNSGSIF